MSNDRSTGGDAPTGEPALTQKNSQTIRGEELLADDVGGVELNAEGDSRTRPKAAANAPAYGAAGGTTDAYEDGAGEADAHGTGS